MAAVVFGTTKPYGIGKFKCALVITSGPASYTTGGFTVTVSELSKVHGAVAVTSGGYVASVAGVSDNTVTIAVYENAGAAGPLAEVGAGTDLSGVTFYIFVVGE